MAIGLAHCYNLNIISSPDGFGKGFPALVDDTEEVPFILIEDPQDHLLKLPGEELHFSDLVYDNELFCTQGPLQGRQDHGLKQGDIHPVSPYPMPPAIIDVR